MNDQYAVIGNPIGHMKSPLIHGLFAKKTGQDITYTAIEGPIEPADAFAATVRTFIVAGGRGMNVTAPFKLQAFAIAAERSERAALAGAVNAMKFENGRIIAENFDGVGLLRDIEVNLKQPLAGKRKLVLGAGSLGLSSLVCLLINGEHGQTETTANLMGPFWRMDSPRTVNGGSIVRSPTRGTPIFVDAWIRDTSGRPVADAEVDVWHTSADGLYENQDPEQAEMNLRGKLTTDAEGHVWFRSVKPAGYPIPASGVAGALLRAQGRHNMRPAHIHFMIYKPGYKTQFSQVYSSDDPHLETDAQFGVTRALVGRYILHDGASAPVADITGPWYSLEHRFVIEAGEARLPRPPITGKATREGADTV